MYVFFVLFSIIAVNKFRSDESSIVDTTSVDTDRKQKSTDNKRANASEVLGLADRPYLVYTFRL